MGKIDSIFTACDGPRPVTQLALNGQSGLGMLFSVLGYRIISKTAKDKQKKLLTIEIFVKVFAIFLCKFFMTFKQKKLKN